MSVTPETDLEFAAAMLADALIREAAASSGHRRLLLRTHLDVSPKQVFAALALRFAPGADVTVQKASPPVQLQAISLPGATAQHQRILVPYLVGEPGPNAGSAGFAALLRDEVPAGPGQKVLLILDRSPVETVRTAAEDATELPALQWAALVQAAARGASDSVAALIRIVLEDDRKFARLPRTAAVLGSLRRIACLADVHDAGEALHSLGCYLSDPAVTADAKRLRSAATWRSKLQDWLAPGQDFESKLSALYPDTHAAGLARVLGAVTPFGLDYAGFTLDDLPGGKQTTRAVRLAQPLSPGEPARMVLGNRAVVWKPGGGVITVALASPATADTILAVKWADDENPAEIAVARGERLVGLSVSGHGWRFARITAEAGSAGELAVFLDSGQWAPFEAGIDLDMDAGAFRCGVQPRVVALDQVGKFVGDPAVTRPHSDADEGEPEICGAALGSEQHPIPLVFDRSANPSGPAFPPDDLPPGSGPDQPGDDPGTDDPDDDDEGAPEGPGTLPGPGLIAPVATSVAHALLTASKHGDDIGAAQFHVSRSGGSAKGIIALPGRYDLIPQSLGSGLDGLELEREILDSPHVTAFTLVRQAGSITVQPHPVLEQLAVSGIDGVDGFLQARATLFAALRPAGSVHAIAAGTALDEAHAYVAAYRALLETLLGSGRFVAEYERLFLCDAVAEASSGELLIAPTSPLSVAYLITLAEHFRSWQSKAGEVLAEDLKSCSMRHLVPYFVLQGEWYETGGPAPLLWRRYRPSSIGVASDYRPSYIKRRIEHFMRVHPEYRDQRQTLGLAFHEPGDGEAVLAALRVLAKPHAEGRSPYPLPRLAVTIVSTSAIRTAVEDLVAGRLSSTPAQAAADKLLQDCLQVTQVMPGEEGPGFAHLSFVFESSLRRETAAVNLGARAGTLFADGLAASPGRHIEPGRNETTFMWGTFTGSGGEGVLTGLVHKSLELVSGMPRDPITRGQTRMPSTRVQRNFLDSLYNDSAWVVHLDKLLGLEAFAPDASGRNARYLIDYEDRLDPAQPGLDAITATNRVEPYRKALSQALAEIGVPSEAGLDRLLQIFNGVSGQWALDLVGANPNDLHERIGLAAAVASLQDLDGGLHNIDSAGVVIPLEEMLQALPRPARPTKDKLCDDLLFVRVPVLTSGSATLYGRLLEVKYRGAMDPRAADTARAQLERAALWLSSTFGDAGAPSRLFRSRDLSELLRAAATRLAAFGLMSQQQRGALEPALEAVARGDFELRLDYQADGQQLHGDFVSLEADSAVAVHRQLLAGSGAPLGHLRLGRPVLHALATGSPIPRPGTLAAIHVADQPDGSAVPEPAPPVPPDDMGSTPGPASAPARPPAAAAPPVAEIGLYAQRLDQAFTKYGLSVEPFRPELAQTGPSLIRFRTRVLGRLSITEVERRARDLGREIAAPGEISVGDEPGFVTVDVPRADREPVPLSAVLPHLDSAAAKPGALNFVAGIAPSGSVEVADLSRLPHLLVAGATGSGKSVFLRGLLAELIRARSPEQLRLLIVDPKRLDFAAFARVPHLRGQPIISDPDEALRVLSSTLEAELAHRQPILEQAGVSSASEYYEAGGSLEDLPQLVILIDEFADLVLAGTDRKAFSELVQRYAQLTRAYGIFLVLATQRPSVDVVTGSIKANLSARIAFSLPSATDSRTILDRGGAEDLLGDGDLLFYRNGRIERLQAPLATGADVRALLA